MLLYPGHTIMDSKKKVIPRPHSASHDDVGMGKKSMSNDYVG